nr:hypothetical protein [Thiocapsa sp. KS1]
MRVLALLKTPATAMTLRCRVDKRSAVHQRRRGVRWTSLSLVHPTGRSYQRRLRVRWQLPDALLGGTGEAVAGKMQPRGISATGEDDALGGFGERTPT